MEMKPVTSSNISAIGFEAASALLHVQFTNGRTYEYQGVAAELFERFEAAESKGRFFAQEIRPKFTGTQFVEQPQAETPAPVSQATDTQAPAEEAAPVDIQTEQDAETAVRSAE